MRRPEGEPGEEVEDDEVAMTRNVVRSKRMTSVALQACAKVVKCLARIFAFGIRVWTIFDHALGEKIRVKERRELEAN